jgi:hypothetical protein
MRNGNPCCNWLRNQQECPTRKFKGSVILVDKKQNLSVAFNSGEYNPALASRIDTEGFKYSVRFAKNFLIEPTGGLKKFYGSKFIDTFFDKDDMLGKIGSIPFHGHSQPIVMYLCSDLGSGTTFRFVAGDTMSASFTSAVNIQTSKDSLRFQQINDLVVVANGLQLPVSIMIEDNPTPVFHISEIEFVDTPYYPIEYQGQYSGVLTNVLHTPTGTIQFNAESGETFDITHLVGRKIKFALSSNSTSEPWYIGKTSVTTNQVLLSEGRYYACVAGGTCGDIKPTHTSGIVSDGKLQWRYIHGGSASGVVTAVNTDHTQITVEMDERTPYLPVTDDITSKVRTFDTYYWGIWGGDENIYPSEIFYFKNRLGFITNTNGFGSYLSLSCTDDFFNFETESYGQVLDTNSINILINGHADNKIKWILVGSKVFLGSGIGEFVLEGHSDGSISPTTARLTPVSTIGGAGVVPLNYNSLNLFVGNGNREIYSLSYDYDTDDYIPKNIGVFAGHLLAKKITKMIPLPNDDRNVFMLTEDLDLLAMYYDSTQKLLGFTRIDLGFPVIDIVSVSTRETEFMYAILKTDDQQSTATPINYMVVRFTNDNPNYLLSEKSVTVSPASNNYTDPAFKNKVGYSMIREGELTNSFIPTSFNSDGVGTRILEVPIENWDFGVEMECEMHSQPFNGQKLEGEKQASIKMIARLNKSGCFDYGSSHNFENWIPFNNWATSQDWASAHTLITGDIVLGLPLGYMVGGNKGNSLYPNDSGVGVNVRSKTPEPFNILSISETYL